MVPNGAKNVTVYDPAAGSGTLVLALAHEIGESNCTIYTQDISQKSNEFLRLNLILNNLVHSLPNVVHDDTLLRPYHKNAKGDGLATFDYIVSNPPFNMDFSDSRDTLAGDNHKKRFFAGVPSIPKKDIEKMAVYLLFIQHILYSLAPKGKAAIVVPTGFLTKSGIAKKIREYLVKEKIKWSDLWEISKGKYRADFLKSFTPDKLKGYYRRFFNRVVDKPSLLFIFTVTCVYTQPCYQAENEVLKFHMQEAFQRIQMDTRPDGFATMIMDELNQDKVKQLKDACHRMMVEGDFVKYENVYHGVLTECSSQSTGIQLADYAVGIMNCYLRKHLMSRGDYTFATDLYTEFVLPHLRKHANGTIVGYGVREVPSDSSIRQVLIPLFN